MNPVRSLLVRLRSTHADDKLIASGMAWVILFVILGKLVGAAKEMAVAWRFGIGASVDAYVFVFNLVSWPAAILFSVLTSVLVPSIAHLREHSPDLIPRFRSELLGITLVASLVVAVLAWAGTPALLRSSWSGLSTATADIAVGMVPILAPTAGLGILIGLCSVFMLSAGHHANTLLEGVPALVLLIAILILSDAGESMLAWGTLAGMGVHLAALSLSLNKSKSLDAPHFSASLPEWKLFRRQFGITLIGVAAMNGAVLVDQFFASHLHAGAVSTLSYANRILALLSGVGSLAIMRATLPVFSQARARGMPALRNSAMQWSGALFLLGTAAALASWWFSPWMIRVLFERGAFSAQDTLAVAGVLRAAVTQLPFFFAGLILVSLLASRQQFSAIALIGCLNLVVKLAANAVLVPHLGVAALMYSTTIMLAASWCFMFAALRQVQSTGGSACA